MTIRFVSLLCGAALLLFAYSDSDMDGVEDYEDKCPNTPFNELVAYDGCSKSGNDKKVDYTLVLGTRYAQKNYSSQLNDDTQYIYIQNNLSYLDWNFGAIISYYRSSNQNDTEHGLDDTLLTLSYQTISNEFFSLSLGVGVILPTYESTYHNEATDYMLTLDTIYFLNNQNYLFANYIYTFVQDSDIQNIVYQNTQSSQLGVGFTQNQKHSYTIAYSRGESIYRDIETIEELRLGASLAIDKNLFGGITYDYGLSNSASAHTFGCYLSYSF